MVRASAAAAVTLFWATFVAASGNHVRAQNCGVDSLASVAELCGRALSEQEHQQLASALPGPTVTMLQIEDAGRALGIELHGVRADLAALASDVPGPKIVHLLDPEHFLVLCRASGEWVRGRCGSGLDRDLTCHRVAR